MTTPPPNPRRRNAGIALMVFALVRGNTSILASLAVGGAIFGALLTAAYTIDRKLNPPSASLPYKQADLVGSLGSVSGVATALPQVPNHGTGPSEGPNHGEDSPYLNSILATAQRTDPLWEPYEDPAEEPLLSAPPPTPIEPPAHANTAPANSGLHGGWQGANLAALELPCDDCLPSSALAQRWKSAFDDLSLPLDQILAKLGVPEGTGLAGTPREASPAPHVDGAPDAAEPASDLPRAAGETDDPYGLAPPVEDPATASEARPARGDATPTADVPPRIARSPTCQTLLDKIVQDRPRPSLQPERYRDAWRCFNEAHQQYVVSTAPQRRDDLVATLPHLEGAASSEPASGGPLAWADPARGGLEYRLVHYLGHVDPSDTRLKDAFHAALGEETIARDLALDLLAEVRVATVASEHPSPSPYLTAIWARRIHVVTLALQSPLGALLRERHADDLDPMIWMLYRYATRAPLPLPVARALASARGLPEPEAAAPTAGAVRQPPTPPSDDPARPPRLTISFPAAP